MIHRHKEDFGPARLLVENIQLLPTGRALDVAMGTGRNAVYLAKKGFDVEGVDISPEAVRRPGKGGRSYSQGPCS